MKIIHITDELQPEAGGLVSVPINLAASQAAQGHEVILIGRTGGARLAASGETEKIPQFKNVTVVDCQQPGILSKVFPIRTVSKLRQHITPGSIVHLHGVWDPILLFASRISRKVGASYVVTPHSMLHPWQMRRFVWQKKIVFAMGWRRMFKEALFIHTLNMDEQKYVEAFDFGAPIEIIPNGIYPEALKEVQPNLFLVKYPHLKDAPYILFLSRLHNQKGIIYLLDGFEEFAKKNIEAQLVLAGPDYGELSVIEEKLRGMKAADRVIIPGPLYGNEKAGALHGATCFALTSLNEGFSVAILEALSCGLPVVISKNCFFPEVAELHAGLIPSLDPIEIAAALHTILNDHENRASLSSNAKALVQQCYSWPNIGQQTINVYLEHQL